MLSIFWVCSLLLLEIACVITAPSASSSPAFRGTYTQSSYWYSDYAIPKTSPKKTYLPAPQYCPETGRTVCAEAKPFYPSDEVFDVISAAKAKRFNISSEFVDESQNDDEPHFIEEQVYNKPKHEGYVVYQTAVHYDYNTPTYIDSNPNNGQVYNPNYNSQQQSSPTNYPTSGYPMGPQDAQQTGYSLWPDTLKGNNNREQYNQNLSPQRNTQPLYGYASHYAPVRYPGDNYNLYTQQNAYQQQQQPQYQNGMFQQQQHGRYKRQTSNDVDPVCPSRVILVEPKAALNDRSQWKFVVNLADKDPRLKQAIKVEVCTTPNQPCSNQISLPFGFVSRCKQKYIKKKLLSLDSSGQSISSENFFAPSCCVCEIVRNTSKK